MEHDPELSNGEVTETTKSSVRERLRQARKAKAEEKTKDIDISGYGGELFCRYRLLDGSDIDKISTRNQSIKDKSERVLATACDTLIVACEEFFIREDGEEKPARTLLEPPIETPIKYDRDLAVLLGFDHELPVDNASARDVVMGLFGGNDLAVSGHVAELTLWMMGGGMQLDAEMGEVLDLLK